MCRKTHDDTAVSIAVQAFFHGCWVSVARPEGPGAALLQSKLMVFGLLASSTSFDAMSGEQLLARLSKPSPTEWRMPRSAAEIFTPCV